MKEINVVKRDGEKEPFDAEKVHKVLYWATEDVNGVTVASIEAALNINLYNGILSSEIHEALIRATVDLITEDAPNYQIVAGRLVMFDLRKKAYGEFEPPHLMDFVNELTNKGLFDEYLLDQFTPDEWDELDKTIKHDRDMNFYWAGAKQLREKYLTKNRTTGDIYETPQFVYMCVAATLFSYEQGEDRLKIVKTAYNLYSQGLISLPTPIMAGVRSRVRQYSSCVVIDCGDNIPSINSTTAAITDYVTRKAGIGLNGGRIRGVGAKIRSGDAFHTGVTPFYRLFESAVKSCSQGGVRNGSATLHCPIWHWEIEDIMVLKNNEGTFDNRVRRLDYSIQINGYMYQRLLEEGEITLFSMEEVPDLYDAFFQDQNLFGELYEMYERKTSIRKKKISSYDLFSLLNTERTKTGRLYIMNVDHCNTHSSFLDWVYMSNLCQEITLPTEPLPAMGEEGGEIALCTLSAINMADLDPDDDDFYQKMEERTYIAVAGLDWLLDHQEYPMKAAEIPCKARRNLGIGVINLAYFLTKRGLNYSDDRANEIIHRWFEAFQFYLIKASVELAKQKGACEWFHRTKYSQGIMPVDSYRKQLDEIAPFKLECDWDWLRAEVLEHGMRNSTLSALMPSETSSQLSNATNGIEPPREPIVVKESEDGNLKQVVPDFYHLKNKYEYEFDMPTPQGYLDKVCIIQKFIDQAISANTSYNKDNYGGKIPEQAKLDDIIRFWYYGGKTLYYDNTPSLKTEETDLDMDDGIGVDDDCPDGVCHI